MRFPINTRVLYTLFSALVIILGSVVAIRYTQGYGRSFSRKSLVDGTGLLQANSFPPGAEVYVNDKLVTATDDTIYLEPGEYQVQIRKDGYTPWQKKLSVESELVTQTNAQLFRQVPSLTPLTFAGASNVFPSPDGEKILFYTASASAQTKNGLYVLDLGNTLLASQREPRQIVEDTPAFDLSQSKIIWSPDNTEVILSLPNKEVLLETNRKNNLTALPDISPRRRQILSQWEEQLYLRERQFLGKFPPEIIQMATQSATNMYLSPDKKKIIYTPTQAMTLPPNIAPALPASSTQPEQRELKPGGVYVYDREEDKNFLISFTPAATATASSKVLLASDLFNRDPVRLEASPSSFQRLAATTSAQTTQNFSQYYSSLYSTGLQWMPDSDHLLFADQDRVYILEYDNTNKTTVYVGPFSNSFVYPWPDGSKLVILTSFSPHSPTNLYAVELK